MIASSMPICPAITPRRAVTGEFNHLIERTIASAAMIYADCQTASVIRASARSFFFAEHLEHPVCDQKSAHDVDCRRSNRDAAEHFAERRGIARSGDQNRA